MMDLKNLALLPSANHSQIELKMILITKSEKNFNR